MSIVPYYYWLREVYFINVQRECTLDRATEELRLDFKVIAFVPYIDVQACISALGKFTEAHVVDSIGEAVIDVVIRIAEVLRVDPALVFGEPRRDR